MRRRPPCWKDAAVSMNATMTTSGSYWRPTVSLSAYCFEQCVVARVIFGEADLRTSRAIAVNGRPNRGVYSGLNGNRVLHPPLEMQVLLWNNQRLEGVVVGDERRKQLPVRRKTEPVVDDGLPYLDYEDWRGRRLPDGVGAGGPEDSPTSRAGRRARPTGRSGVRRRARLSACAGLRRDQGTTEPAAPALRLPSCSLSRSDSRWPQNLRS